MACKVDSFKSDSGKVHESEHTAWIDDLDHWLGKSGIDNAPIRKAVVDAIKADIANGNHLVTIIDGIKRTAPAPVLADLLPYRVPKSNTPRARCMGGDNCNHGRDECTADPDYQRWIAADQIYASGTGPDDPAFETLSENQHQFWLNEAEKGI